MPLHPRFHPACLFTTLSWDNGHEPPAVGRWYPQAACGADFQPMIRALLRRLASGRVLRLPASGSIIARFGILSTIRSRKKERLSPFRRTELRKGYALSKESCAKTFGGRTGLNTLSSNFRQFSLWLAAKSRLGPMKKPEAVRLEQAPSAVSRFFRDCYAILGLLRRPTPDLRALYTKLTCSPCSRNDVGLPTSITRSVIAAIWKMLDQACLNPALFHLRRISGARCNPSPIQSTGGSN